MVESVFRYVLNHLSVLTDEQLAELDFGAGLAAINKSELNQCDKQKLKALFLAIQKELPISHHGVLGMKWGVRRYQNKDGSLTPKGKQRLADNTAKQSIFGTASRFQVETRNGELITAEPLKPPSIGLKIINYLMGTSDKMGHRGDANYTLNNSKGEKIGELSLISKNANTTYWDWIAIDESQRGKGYATDVINTLFSKAKEAGYSKVEMNALKKPRPLYERLGFTYTDTSKISIMDRITGYEFGAKRMEYDLTELRHSTAEFYHHGILGMKWGVRRTQEQLGYKEKLDRIASKQNHNTSDIKLAQYNKKSLAARLGSEAAAYAVSRAITVATTGVNPYSSGNKQAITKQLIKDLSGMATYSASTVAFKGALGKSMVKNYDDSGKVVTKGRNSKLFTKEDILMTASTLAPYAMVFSKMKMAEARNKQYKNEERFNRWGRNILTEKTGDVIWATFKT